MQVLHIGSGSFLLDLAGQQTSGASADPAPIGRAGKSGTDAALNLHTHTGQPNRSLLGLQEKLSNSYTSTTQYHTHCRRAATRRRGGFGGTAEPNQPIPRHMSAEHVERHHGQVIEKTNRKVFLHEQHLQRNALEASVKNASTQSRTHLWNGYPLAGGGAEIGTQVDKILM